MSVAAGIGRCRFPSVGHPDIVEEARTARSSRPVARLRDSVRRHPWLSALTVLLATIVVLYAAFVLKFAWDMQHSSL